MRIIAGRYKGRRLQPPTWEGLRPTSDKLRETLFNILAPHIENARVFDGYAGTGALGIEALSRGARHVTFVERDRRATALIERNLTAAAVEGGYTIRCGEVLTALQTHDAEAPFDVILLDPPYDTARLAPVLGAETARLSPEGLLVLERATRREPETPSGVRRVRDVKSGDSTLTFFMRRAATSDGTAPESA